MQSPEKRRFWLVSVALIVGSLAVYGSLIHAGFVGYDDPAYVTGNSHVQNGLTPGNVIWAFTTGYNSNWHPLTWLSHMLDCQFYGLNAGGHHVTSLLFHLANSILLFGLLRRLTGATWRSAVVAALFAWHPLHVESVAWISERKDVLSAFFWFLAIWAYVAYVQGSTPGRPNSKSKSFYSLSLLFFVLGLLSKPMVVTLPFVLLLLDYWPLGRISDFKSQISDLKPEGGEQHVSLYRLLLEKVPFFALAAAASVVTVLVQKSGAMVPLFRMSFSQRVANAVVAYVEYVRKMFWPNDLAVFYPHPKAWPVWQPIGAAFVLLLATIAVVMLRRSRPYLLVGWLWFVGTLVPVIGLVQVGQQSMADRYSYLPLIGLFIMLVWGAADLSQAWPPKTRRLVLGTAGALVLVGCLGLTRSQARTWQNSVTLFERALSVVPRNAISLNNLGAAMEELGRTNEARADYEAALQLEPRQPYVLFSKGLLLKKQGQIQAAIDCLQAALRSKPDYAAAHYELGRMLAESGRSDEAVTQYQECLRYESEPADVHYNLANALALEGKLNEAVDHYRESLRLKPDSPDAHNNLGAVLVRLGAFNDAMNEFKAALRLKPAFPEAEDQLGGVLQRLGQWDAAKNHFAEAVRLKPDFAHAQLKLGLLLAQQAQFEDAKTHLLKAARLEPTNDAAYYDLGGVFAAQGRLDDAAASFTEVVRLKPQDADARVRLAAVLAQAGRPEAAIPQLREAVRLKPDWAEPLRALATILATNPNAGLRNGGEAVQLAGRANDLTGHRDPGVLTALDEAYAEAGRFEDAIKTAQQSQDMAASAKQPALAEQAAKRLELYRAGKPYRE